MRLYASLLWGRHNKLESLLGLFAYAIGLLVLALSLQAFMDFSALLSEGARDGGKSYALVSKHLEGILPAPARAYDFRSDEIEMIRALPFVSKLELGISNNFGVKLEVSFAGMGLSTMGFFEAVPDDYLGSVPSEFHWRTPEDIVPIMLSREYLTLYNIGFAASRNLPTAGEGLIESIAVDLEIEGERRTAFFKAKIVGFTDRISTILVPESFLSWANAEYSPKAKASARRLVVEIKAGEEAIADAWFREHASLYERSGGDQASKALVRGLLGAVQVSAAVGGFLLILVFAILLLVVKLMVYKSRATIENLLILGYTKRGLSFRASLIPILAIAFASILAVAMAIPLAILLRDLVAKSLSLPMGSDFIGIAAVGLSGFALMGAFFFAYTRGLIGRLFS